MRNKTNHLLDCLKGIACISVVFIHVHFPGICGDIVWRLAQFAVPIFFMTSGYVAYSMDKTGWNKKKQVEYNDRKYLAFTLCLEYSQL